MKPDMFEEPVTILTGLGIPTPAPPVMHAYIFLLEWSSPHHDPGHAIAPKACKAALTGVIEAKTARSVLVAFAERHDLLVPESALARHCATDTAMIRTCDKLSVVGNATIVGETVNRIGNRGDRVADRSGTATFVRTALQDAASVARLLIKTEAMIPKSRRRNQPLHSLPVLG